MKKIFIEFQAIRLKNKAVYWTLNISISFLLGLICSLFFKGDREKILAIIIAVITDVIVISLLGGYFEERKKFERKYKNRIEKL